VSPKRFLQKLQSIFLFLLIVSFPTQLAKHFWPGFSYIWGIRVDYLAPAIYLSDIFALTMIAIFIIQNRIWSKVRINKVSILVRMLIIANIVFSFNPEISMFKWLKILEFGLLVYVFSIYKFRDIKKEVILPLLVSTVFISLIGIMQFFRGSTIGGILYFLGERRFSILSPGIALVDIYGKEFLRAYSTFPHPNSLAGFLLVAGILVMYLGKGLRFLLIPLLVCFLFTFSRGAFIALFVVITLYVFRSIKRGLTDKTIYMVLLPILIITAIQFFWPGNIINFDNIKISERLYLIDIAKTLVIKNPIFGIGVNNFILEIPKYISYEKSGWLLQPVHNIFIRILVETGMLGLILFFIMIYKSLFEALKTKKEYLVIALIIILVTGLFDHYWLTLQQNMLLGSLVLGLTFNKSFK